MTSTRFSRRGSRGIALVFLLAMVVLLTVLVVLILTRATLNRQISSSSSGQQKADQLAQAGLQNLVNDLRQEIAAGSSTRTSPATFISTYNSINVTFPASSYQSTKYASTNVYIPTSNQTSVPAFAGYGATTPANDYFPNLLKRSAYNTYFFPNSTPSLYKASTFPPSNVASNLNTGASSSLDGRSISSARWNKPMLMDLTKPGATFTPPDWVIVTRSGPKAFAGWNANLSNQADQANYAVGRYAYMIYDEGGLLDANTAGCNSVNYPGGTAAMATDFDKTSKRGRLGQADLTALPGLTQADIDKLVQWRNATTANSSSNPAQSYFSYLFHGNFSAGSFQYNFSTTSAPVVDPSSAFMTTINGDQSFLSRQDLINFFNFNYPNAATTENQALPYLGTFSRELNAPSYCPPDPNLLNSNTITGGPAMSKDYKYASNAELATLPASGNPNPNRNFPGVKFAHNGTLPDGTVVTAGQPLVRRRFALSRLQLIVNKLANPTDTSASALANDALIHNYFGLTYDSTSGKWTYTSPDANIVATTIKTLDQVAQLSPPREPDFFELLQAGILHGSLGQTAGKDNKGQSTSGSETVQYDSCPDSQIIQIGANIISQYCPETNTQTTPPTTSLITITYSPVTPANVALGPIDFYAVQNIPYISKISQVIYREESSSWDAGNTGMDPVSGYGNPWDNNNPFHRPYVSAWLQIELWNPHQQPQNSPQLPMQIYAVGDAETVVYNGNSAFGGTDYGPWVDGTGVYRPCATVSPTKNFTSAETISVPVGAYALADYFREPHVLTPDMGVSASLTADHLLQSNKFSLPGQWNFIGFKTGDAFGPDDSADEVFNPYPPTPPGPPTGPCQFMDPYFAGITSQGGITFYLQVKDPTTGNWVTVQRIKRCVVRPDPNETKLPSSWVKRYDQMPSFMVPTHSQYQSQINGTDYNLNGHPSYTLGSAYRMLPDPRTDRFGVFEGAADSNGQYIGPMANQTALPGNFSDTSYGLFGDYTDYDRMRTPTQVSNYSWSGGGTYPNSNWNDGRVTFGYWDTKMPGNGLWAGLLMLNTKNPPATLFSNFAPYNSAGATQKANFYYYYADPDTVIRGGDGYYADSSDQDGNGFPDGYQGYMGTSGTARPERPVFLNRPFRSVGELGYVHRGELWKSLDFFTRDSADAGLLDLFSIDEEDVVAGTVDLNTRQAPVIQAILQGAAKNEFAASASDSGDPVFSTTDAAGLANKLATERLGTASTSGPLANRGELVTRFLGQNATTTPYTQFPLNKTRREAMVRPLAAVGNTRTWNLLIDIIAQSGRYPTTANALGQFVIEGEKRYWWHVAIDRYTGQIVDSQLEPVYE